jgi:hypothetical protein
MTHIHYAKSFSDFLCLNCEKASIAISSVAGLALSKTKNYQISLKIPRGIQGGTWRIFRFLFSLGRLGKAFC